MRRLNITLGLGLGCGLVLIGCSAGYVGDEQEASTGTVGQSLPKNQGGTQCDPDYCVNGGCTLGEGDCDSNAQCVPGTICGKNNGTLGGCAANIDICVPCPSFVLGLDNRNFCNPNCPCTQGQGDCDSDADCQGSLVCVQNVGALYGMAATYDICELPSYCPPYDLGNDNRGFCTPDCPCSEGQGDCDSDADCAGSLVCMDNLGALHGLPATYDVCEPPTFCPPFDPLSDNRGFCTPDCPCNQGQGDCDSPADCLSGLDCIKDLGANYSLPAGYDVCEVCLDGPDLPVPINGTLQNTAYYQDRRTPACGGPVPGTPDITLGFTAPEDGVYRFSTEGSGFDTVLALYDGDCNGPELGCIDDSPGVANGGSVMQAPLSAGQTVVVLITGADGAEGAGYFDARRVYPCCSPSAAAGCDGGPVEAAIQDCVCASVPACCTGPWNATCVELVGLLGCADACPAVTINPCCTYTGVGCPADPAIEACVCGYDSFCCTNAWDGVCQGEVASLCGGYCG